MAQDLLSGDARSLARAMSLVENGAPEAEALLDRIYGARPPAPRVGMTGPPGAGKSTLVAEYALLLRRLGRRVGVVAVDPTSPFTGGAILGDRVRMSELSTDPGVFIRSMATRGSLGGLAGRTEELCELLSAWGSDVTLIETVGVGQSELDVAQAADTTVVVLTPESGDAIQSLKAGLMEIADVFVVNKADHAGADQLAAAIRSALALRPASPPRLPRVAMLRMKTPGSVESSLMRTRSPRIAPPVKGLVGSTATTPTRRPKRRSRSAYSATSVLFPAPGGPVMPTRGAGGRDP
ncbi:MAG TPA: methylmalonyl Co-A mutase-associated GTPase MeaB [Candidatus Limnocylindrales bacterium]|nr:methylmalonyl Co-A mutase-associated GTPase MeaB [Candidatus Limnocylindrales bacterium]